MHELTHVQQGRNKMIRDVQILVAALNRDYDHTLGHQWHDYGPEQQGETVEDCATGEVERGKAHPNSPLSIGSPLFRYIQTTCEPTTAEPGRCAERRSGSSPASRAGSSD
jgi:hypothetical protein